MKLPRPVTRDQEFLAAIYEEQVKIRRLLEAQGSDGEFECDVCHKRFHTQRGLNAHSGIHKKGV